MSSKAAEARSDSSVRVRIAAARRLARAFPNLLDDSLAGEFQRARLAKRLANETGCSIEAARNVVELEIGDDE